LAAGPIGVMQACLDLVVPYVQERSQFGQPIGRFQLIQAKLADMYVALSSTTYVYAVAKACDRGETTREDAAVAIPYPAARATWMALEPSNAWVATAISTTIRPVGCCATPSCTRSAPAQAKSAAC